MRLKEEYERTHASDVMKPLVLLALCGLVSALTLYALNPNVHGHTLHDLSQPVPLLLLACILLTWLVMVSTMRSFRAFSLACVVFLGLVYTLEGWLVRGSIERVTWMMPTFLVWSLAIAPLTIRPRTFLIALGITVLTPLALLANVGGSNALLWLTVIFHLVAVSSVALVVFRTINKTRRQTFLAGVALREAAWRDSLTKLLTRRRFFERAEAQFERLRHTLPISACFLDLDDFKRINDEFGHAAGDEALARAAAVLADLDPLGDGAAEDQAQVLVARMGGEEFAMLLPGYTQAQALHLANGLVCAIREDRPGGMRIRASAGVAELGPGEDLSRLLHHADLALLQAKRSGKDRAMAFDATADWGSGPVAGAVMRAQAGN